MFSFFYSSKFTIILSYDYSKAHRLLLSVQNRQVGCQSVVTKTHLASCTTFGVRGVYNVSSHTQRTCVRCGSRPALIICSPVVMTTSLCSPTCKVTNRIIYIVKTYLKYTTKGPRTKIQPSPTDSQMNREKKLNYLVLNYNLYKIILKKK